MARKLITATSKKLTAARGAVRRQAKELRDIKPGKTKRPGSAADREKEMKLLEANLERARERVKKAKAEAEGAPAAPRKSDTGPTKEGLKKKRREVREEPKDRKGPKAKKNIAEEEKLDKRMREKDASRARKKRSKDIDEVGIIQRLEDRKQEEIAIRRGGNKGRDFEAKVDSEQAGRGAFRKKLDFDRQDLAKQQRNYTRQKARFENKNLTGAERRAAQKEMDRLEAQYGNAVTTESIKLAKRPAAPKRRTPIGDKAPKAPKPISLRAAFNQAKKDGDKKFTFEGTSYNTATLEKRFAAKEAELGLKKGGDVKKNKIPVVTVGIGMMPAPKGKKPRTGSADFRNGGMVMSSTNNLKPVPSGNKGKGLRALPKSVRNNMGFMRKGGMVKK